MTSCGTESSIEKTKHNEFNLKRRKLYWTDGLYFIFYLPGKCQQLKKNCFPEISLEIE